MNNSIKETKFNLPNQTKFYKGKVRDVYTIGSDQLVMVVSDRISAFDVVLPEGIPYKGQVLSQIASKFLDATSDIVPNWKQATPDPNVTVGKMCDPFKVEMVIRGYLTGHAWREYKAGKRTLCGVAIIKISLSESTLIAVTLVSFNPPSPVVTPTLLLMSGLTYCEQFPGRVICESFTN